MFSQMKRLMWIHVCPDCIQIVVNYEKAEIQENHLLCFKYTHINYNCGYKWGICSYLFEKMNI